MLNKILGLYTTFHPTSTFKCPFCIVTDKQISDFSIDNWEFRNIEAMTHTAEKVENKSIDTKTKFAKINYGIHVSKLFCLDKIFCS